MFRILYFPPHLNSSSGDSSSLVDGGLLSYISTTFYSLKDLLCSAVQPFSASTSSSPPTHISEESMSLLPSSETSSQSVSKSEWIILKDTHDHTPGMSNRSSAKSLSTCTGSLLSSSTGSATGPASDFSPILRSSRGRIFGQEIKAENSLKSPPEITVFEQKKDL